MKNLTKHAAFPFGLMLLGAIVIFSGCRKDDLQEEDENEEIVLTVLPDWTEETHGDSSAPDYETVFDHGEVIRFDIVIDPEDWSDMQDDLDANLESSGGRPGPPTSSDFTPIWVPCSFFFNGVEWYHVGIRYKGNSSLKSSYQSGIDKLSFKVDFDEYEDDYPEIKNQRFYGFRQLNLKNNFDDNSLVREKVGADLFREFGLASSRTAFCVVYVDYGSGPVYFGVYTLVEEVDDTVMDSQFESGEGNLYKPDGRAASFAAGSYNASQMEKKTNEEQADYSDVYTLYETINSGDRTTDPESWKTALNSCFNVDVFLKWLASNTAMQNWDTYGIMTHNYYLYNDPSNELLTWIPWDNNEAFQEGKQGGALSLPLSEVNSYWPLIRYLMDDDTYRSKYLSYAADVVDGPFKPSGMIARYRYLHSLIEPYVTGTDGEVSGYTFLGSSTYFYSALDDLIAHVQERAAMVAGVSNE